VLALGPGEQPPEGQTVTRAVPPLASGFLLAVARA
jgi:hypothetical protein